MSDPSALLDRARVAHLATADPTGRPHVIPVCFIHLAGRIYIALDEKPKRAPVTRLRRVRNLRANPAVSLVIDHYSEDWSALAYVLVEGQAGLLEDGPAYDEAISRLREKYPQYHTMAIEQQPLIAISIERVVHWQAQPAQSAPETAT